MGLAEIVQAGAKLTRDVVGFTESPAGTGSILLGPTYGILTIQTSQGCRLRLYDRSESLHDPTEINREFGNYNIPDDIALVGDFTMSSAGSYTIDPMLYGHAHDSINTHYRIESKSVGSPAIINITRFLIEDPLVQPSIGGQYTKNNRRSIGDINANLSASEIRAGTLVGDDIPTTYILVSASITSNTQIARLRLYNTSSALYDETERLRSFSTEVDESSRLIVDVILSGSTPVYFSPKLIGANLQRLKNNLNDLRVNQTKIFGESEIYYLLQNANTGGSVPISASLYVYSLEE